MAFNFSIGDIMLLSSLAWKIGRAFTSGRNGAPAEFQEVENELNALNGAITLLADALDDDDSILARSDDKTKEGLDKILGCCQQTLDSLESLVNQYQEIIKPEGDGGGTYRKWKGSFLRNYKKMWWTSEGGSIQDLRNMLHMHVSSISLTLKALQSKSLARLESTIEPMAKKVDGIHNSLVDNLEGNIADMHNLMMSMTTPGASPPLGPQRTNTAMSLAETLTGDAMRNSDSSINIQQRSVSLPKLEEHGMAHGLESMQATPELNGSEFSSYSSPVIPESREGRWSDMIPRDSHYSIASAMDSLSKTDTSRWSGVSDEFPTSMAEMSPRTSHIRRLSSSLGVSTLSPVSLPPPAMRERSASGEDGLHIVVPSGLEVEHANDRFPKMSVMGDPDVSDRDMMTAARLASSIEEKELFERAIYTDSAVLCEAEGAAVEYTQQVEDKPGEFEMIEASSSCKISIVTKRYRISENNTRYITSIWAMSDDRSVRLQQKLADGVEIIPYTLWGNKQKVVVRIPTELKFHGVTPKDKPLDIASTSWINYIFKNERGAIEFQNTLMGKRLLHSFKTRRTLRLHDNIVSNTFTFQEQLCGLENLRLWSDDEGDGSVLAMIQYSANFKEGYLAFRLRGPYTTVLVRDEAEKWIKVKGLDVSLGSGTDPKALKRRKSSDAGRSPKLGKEKRITAVKIEFETLADKKVFLEHYRVRPPKNNFFG